MKKALPYIIAAVVIGGALTPVYLAKHASTEAKDKPTISNKAATDIQKISYALGFQVSQQTPPEVDTSLFAEGMHDGQAKKKPRFTEQELSAALAAYQQQAQKKALAKQQETAKSNDTFLSENAKKQGVVTTPSGLQYQVLKQGTGKQPTATSSVTVHYEGKLVNGTVFDSSIARKEPATFPLNQVIAGWTEGLQLMKEGSEYRFFIPAKLGYGEQDMGSIPPNSTLIFDVTLIKVNS